MAVRANLLEISMIQTAQSGMCAMVHHHCPRDPESQAVMDQVTHLHRDGKAKSLGALRLAVWMAGRATQELSAWPSPWQRP